MRRHSIAVRRHSDRHLSLFCVGGLGERNEALSDVWELQAQLREGPSLTLLCAWRKLPLPQVEPQTGNQSPSQRLLPFLWMPLQPSILVLEVSRRRRPGLPASASQESARRKTDFRVAVGDAPSGSAESEVSSEVGDVSLLPHQQQRRRLLLFVIGGCRNTGVFASLGDAALAPKSQMLSQRGAFISRFERTDWGRCGCALYELRPSLPAAVAQKLSDRQRVVSPPPVSAGRQTHSHSTHQKLQTQTEAEFQAQTQTQSQSELQLQRHSQQESNRKEGGGGEAASGEEDSCNKKLLEGKASLINQLREKMKRKGLGLSGKATVEDELRSNNTNNFTNNNNGVQQSSAAVPVRAESLNAAAKQGAEDAASLTNASSARGVAGEDSAAPEPRPLIALLQLQQQLAKARLLTQQHQDANSRETPPQETEHSEGAAAVGSFSASGNPRSPAEGALLPSSPGDSGEGAGHSPPGRVSFRLNARPLDARVQTQIRQCRAALERDLEEGEEIELPLELRRLILKAQRWGAEGSGSFSSSPSNRPRQNAAAANAGASEGLSTEANATLAAAPQVQAIDALCPTQEQLQQQPHRHTAQPVRQEGRRQDQAALGEAPPASLSPPPESLLLALPAPPSRGFGLHWGVSSKGAADSFSQKRRLSDAAAMWEGGAGESLLTARTDVGGVRGRRLSVLPDSLLLGSNSSIYRGEGRWLFWARRDGGVGGCVCLWQLKTDVAGLADFSTAAARGRFCRVGSGAAFRVAGIWAFVSPTAKSLDGVSAFPSQSPRTRLRGLGGRPSRQTGSQGGVGHKRSSLCLRKAVGDSLQEKPHVRRREATAEFQQQRQRRFQQRRSSPPRLPAKKLSGEEAKLAKNAPTKAAVVLGTPKTAAEVWG